MSEQSTYDRAASHADALPTLDFSEPVAPAQPKSWSGESVLELRHLHRFFGKLKAVNDVSFKAYPGQVLGYIGPNGAGKTTSMRIIEAGSVLAFSTIEELSKRQRHEEGQTGQKTLAVQLLANDDPKHSPAALERWLFEQPFVSAVQVAGLDVTFEFDGDPDAQHQLLRGPIHADFPAIEFHGKTETLEDAFMSITKGVMQ